MNLDELIPDESVIEIFNKIGDLDVLSGEDLKAAIDQRIEEKFKELAIKHKLLVDCSDDF